MRSLNKYFKSSKLLVIILAVIDIAIILTSMKYYWVEKQTIIGAKSTELQGVSDIKVNQINDWRNERLSDANYLAGSLPLAEVFQALQRNKGDTGKQAVLFNNLNAMYQNRKYVSMRAIDKNGHCFYSLPEKKATILTCSNDHPEAIEYSNRIIIGDLHLNKDSATVLHITVPILDRSVRDTLVTGWIILTIDPQRDFFPLLESMPILSETLEVLLIHKDKDKITYVNLPKCPTLVTTRLNTLDRKVALPAFKAVNGLWGTEEGVDYKGVPVLATMLPVNVNNWYLVVKINKTEAYAEIRKMRIFIGALAILLMVAINAVVLFFWSLQRGELMRIETERRLISERFDLLSKYANDAIILFAKDLTILQVNNKALELYGYTRAEFIGMSAELLRSPGFRAELNTQLEEIIKEEGLRFETVHIRKDATEFPAEVSTRYIEIIDDRYFQSIIRDISQRKQFERALIESEERLKLITNTTPQIIWTASPTGRIDFVNSRFEAITGILPFRKNTLTEAIHPDDYGHVITFWSNAISQIREHQVRFRLKLRGGVYRWFLCIITPLCNENLTVVKWFGSATDINELENLVALRTAELSDLYNHAPCGYFSLNKDCTFVKINDTALTWLGYSGEEIVDQKTFFDLVTPECRETFRRNLNTLKSWGFADNLQYEMIRKDGSLLPVLLNATANKDSKGDTMLIRTTIIDHTERKRYENEILKLNNVLQEHSNNLEYTNSELEAFIYSVSHDLRAPLRAIKGFSQILLDLHINNLDEEGRKLLLTVNNNAHRMGLLIDDLLRLSRVSRQELNYAKIDMKSLFNSLIEETRQHFPDNQFNVVLNQLKEAYGDLALLKQIITNLLSNAVKFSSKQEKAEIIIGSAPGEHESVFYVRDNGIGFDMKYAPELFDVFHRLHNTGDYEGTGIGLALVKRIIERHGGRIWVESEPHKGAAFYFALPEKTGY